MAIANPRQVKRGGLHRGRQLRPSQVVDFDIEARAAEILNRHPAVGLAVGVVRNGRLESFQGSGYADIATKRPITEDTVFRIASLTKTFTAIAVMQLWERGLVDLDAPANDYLSAYKLVPARSRFGPVTLRHLLTHTAGIREVLHVSGLLRMRDLGETVRRGRPVPSLAEYYRGGLRYDAEPGTRWMYSDHDFTTLGQIVEDVSGLSYGAYLRERIFDPLGMAHSDVARSDRISSQLATAYELRSRGPEPVPDYDLVTLGGGGIYSTPSDMARYVAALLGGGANEHGRVLQPATLASMFEPQYRPDPRMAGMGLAFFRANLGGHLAVEHSGILPGFDAQMYLAPNDGVGVMAFANGAKRGMMWLAPEAAAMLRQLLGVDEDAIRTDLPQHPEVWSDLCGWYRFSTNWAHPGRFAIGPGVEVYVHRGELRMRFLTPIPFLYRGFALHPDDGGDPYVFRTEFPWFGMGMARIVFSQRPTQGITAVHIDGALLSFPKQPALTNPRRWIAGVLGGVAVGTAAEAARLRRDRTRCDAD